MTVNRESVIQLLRYTSVSVILLIHAAAGVAQVAPIIQPGAPGDAARVLTAEEAIEIARGLDVFALVPSEYLSVNEVVAALLAEQGGRFNAQQQFRVTWPAEPVIARAYIDQLERSEALSDAQVADLTAALDRSASQLDARAPDEALAAELESLAAVVDDDSGDAITIRRRAGLAETLSGIAGRLR